MKIGSGRRSSINTYGGEQGYFCRFMLLSFIVLFAVAEAQPSDSAENNRQPYARFSPSMAVIVVVLVSALFFMGFFSIYIRHCADSSGAAASLGRALSTRARRAAAARGLDRSVLETFPTFPYAEVKDHKIGKGALECAVCLNEFEPDETLRLLPKCDHVFHSDCIDAWLESHVTCPVCRANLAATEEPVEVPAVEAAAAADDATARSNSTRNEEIVIQVAAEDQAPNRNGSFEYPSRPPPFPPRSWSIRMPRMFSFGKFRSHSTGHSLVQPVENLDRFTLRLPAQVRKDVIDRAMLNRTTSFATTLPRESSSRRGYRSGGGEGSSRGGRSYRPIELPDRTSRSDRWAFFTRALSMKSPKVGAENSEGSTSKRSGSKTPVKMPSFKCLEPKANAGDETHLISKEPV